VALTPLRARAERSGCDRARVTSARSQQRDIAICRTQCGIQQCGILVRLIDGQTRSLPAVAEPLGFFRAKRLGSCRARLAETSRNGVRNPVGLRTSANSATRSDRSRVGWAAIQWATRQIGLPYRFCIVAHRAFPMLNLVTSLRKGLVMSSRNHCLARRIRYRRIACIATISTDAFGISKGVGLVASRLPRRVYSRWRFTVCSRAPWGAVGVGAAAVGAAAAGAYGAYRCGYYPYDRAN